MPGALPSPPAPGGCPDLAGDEIEAGGTHDEIASQIPGASAYVLEEGDAIEVVVVGGAHLLALQANPVLPDDTVGALMAVAWSILEDVS